MNWDKDMAGHEKFWTGAAAITGAGSGLGAAMAKRFADQGMAILALVIDGDAVKPRTLHAGSDR